jgi:hypothetical protein
MANPTKKNEVAVDANGVPDFSGFEKEQIAFPPYWNPAIGKKVFFTPVMLDDKDSNFLRFVCKAGMVIDCSEGPSDNQKDVKVKAGEYFTISQYTSLPLENYFGYPVLVEVMDLVKFKGGDGTPRTRWVFELRVAPETKRLLEAAKIEAAKALTSAS